jgi:hypothetical protein
MRNGMARRSEETETGGRKAARQKKAVSAAAKAPVDFAEAGGAVPNWQSVLDRPGAKELCGPRAQALYALRLAHMVGGSLCLSKGHQIVPQWPNQAVRKTALAEVPKGLAREAVIGTRQPRSRSFALRDADLPVPESTDASAKWLGDCYAGHRKRLWKIGNRREANGRRECQAAENQFSDDFRP